MSAANAFHAQAQRYPEKLQELVPAYLARIPRAKYALSFSEFVYFPSESDPRLVYTALPPSGRSIYSFARGQWSYVD